MQPRQGASYRPGLNLSGAPAVSPVRLATLDFDCRSRGPPRSRSPGILQTWKTGNLRRCRCQNCGPQRHPPDAQKPTDMVAQVAATIRAVILLPPRLPVDNNTGSTWNITLMPITPEQLFVALDALGIVHSTVKHPPLFTVEQSRSLRGQIPGGHTKNLFLRDKKYAIYLVVALENADIDLKGLHRRLGATGRFSFGSADLLREVLGVEPGAVTPFGAINDTQDRVTTRKASG